MSSSSRKSQSCRMEKIHLIFRFPPTRALLTAVSSLALRKAEKKSLNVLSGEVYTQWLVIMNKNLWIKIFSCCFPPPGFVRIPERLHILCIWLFPLIDSEYICRKSFCFPFSPRPPTSTEITKRTDTHFDDFLLQVFINIRIAGMPPTWCEPKALTCLSPNEWESCWRVEGKKW